MEDVPGRSFGAAWVLLASSLGVHVADEALTGFLSVYNPTVIALRQEAPWLPLPVFRFDVWLGGLVLGIALLLALARFAFRGSSWLRPVAYVLATLMVFNALSHATATLAGRTFGAVRLAGPMPGFYSSPFLLAASVYLLVRLSKTRPPASALP